MTPEQVAALQRYVSATCAFMVHETTGREFLLAKAHLEATFGKALPTAPKPPAMPDLL